MKIMFFYGTELLLSSVLLPYCSCLLSESEVGGVSGGGGGGGGGCSCLELGTILLVVEVFGSSRRDEPTWRCLTPLRQRFVMQHG